MKNDIENESLLEIDEESYAIQTAIAYLDDKAAFPLSPQVVFQQKENLRSAIEKFDEEKKQFRRLFADLVSQVIEKLEPNSKSDEDKERLNPFSDENFFDFVMFNLATEFLCFSLEENTESLIAENSKFSRTSPTDKSLCYVAKRTADRHPLMMSFVREKSSTEENPEQADKLKVELTFIKEPISSCMVQQLFSLGISVRIVYAEIDEKVDFYTFHDDYNLVEYFYAMPRLINYFWQHFITLNPVVMIGTLTRHNQIETAIHYWKSLLTTYPSKLALDEDKKAYGAFFEGGNVIRAGELYNDMESYLSEFDDGDKVHYQKLLEVFQLKHYVNPDCHEDIRFAHIRIMSHILREMIVDWGMEINEHLTVVKDLISCGAYLYTTLDKGTLKGRLFNLYKEDGDLTEAELIEVFHHHDQTQADEFISKIMCTYEEWIKQMEKIYGFPSILSTLSESSSDSESENSFNSSDHSENENDPEDDDHDDNLDGGNDLEGKIDVQQKSPTGQEVNRQGWGVFFKFEIKGNVQSNKAENNPQIASDNESMTCNKRKISSDSKDNTHTTSIKYSKPS